MHGLLLIDKPAGLTSHDVVARARRELKEKKSGHAGTLDPQATGLLVLAFGDATRWLPYLPGDKRYRARVKFGIETDTQDAWGRVTAQKDASHLKADEIRAALLALKSETSQVPPMVSALKFQGKPLYEYAREGVEIERAPRKLEIFDLKVTEVQGDEAEFELHCGSGTYVRSLCALAGARLGVGACMSALTRLSVGPFQLAGACKLEQMDASRLLGPQVALGHLKEYQVAAADEPALAHGQALAMPEGSYDESETWRMSASDGTLLGLATPKRSEGGWRLQPERVFARK